MGSPLLPVCILQVVRFQQLLGSSSRICSTTGLSATVSYRQRLCTLLHTHTTSFAALLDFMALWVPITPTLVTLTSGAVYPL